jgi:SNF2 family DNA or RNA helicase
LCAYQYHHDRERIRTVFPDAPSIDGSVDAKQSKAIADRWNAGKIPLLLVQPQALSHGINMQYGGSDVCWFGLTDSPETHTQFNARLWRQGQRNAVRIHYLLARRTVDEAVYERIEAKDATQAALLTAIKNYRDRHLNTRGTAA